jgi:hypothetical protein
VSAPEATGEVTVLPGVIQVIAGIVFARVMAYPGFAIDVGSVGMSRLIAVIAILHDGLGMFYGFGAAARDGWMAAMSRGATFRMLRKCRDSKNKQSCKSQLYGFHRFLQMSIGWAACFLLPLYLENRTS